MKKNNCIKLWMLKFLNIIYKISFFYCFLKCDIMRNLVYKGMVNKLMIRFM